MLTFPTDYGYFLFGVGVMVVGAGKWGKIVWNMQNTSLSLNKNDTNSVLNMTWKIRMYNLILLEFGHYNR